jgi:hypothetical protein
MQSPQVSNYEFSHGWAFIPKYGGGGTAASPVGTLGRGGDGAPGILVVTCAPG